MLHPTCAIHQPAVWQTVIGLTRRSASRPGSNERNSSAVASPFRASRQPHQGTHLARAFGQDQSVAKSVRPPRCASIASAGANAERCSPRYRPPVARSSRIRNSRGQLASHVAPISGTQFPDCESTSSDKPESASMTGVQLLRRHVVPVR